MPRLSIVPLQSQKELLVKCEDLMAELHDLTRFQEGNYVEDVGPDMYGEYVRGLNGLARSALEAAKFYLMKQALADQERQITAMLRKRQAGQAFEADRTPPDKADRPRRERVRL